MQSVFEAYVLSDEDGMKRMKNEMKAAMGVRWGDGSGALIYLKQLVEGQTVPRMIGYVRKDRNLSTFHNRNKGVTEDMIAAGIAEHQSLKLSYTDNKILITKSNMFQKAFVKWTNEIAPATVSFSTVMTKLLNDNAHVLSATILMNSNGQMRRSAAEVYWALLMGKEITEYEVRTHPSNAPWTMLIHQQSYLLHSRFYCSLFLAHIGAFDSRMPQVRHMLFLPKNAFSGVEYVPHELPEKHEGLFGDSDDEEPVEGAVEGEAGAVGRCARRLQRRRVIHPSSSSSSLSSSTTS